MVPLVDFSPESASALECITWAVKSVIAGELVEEAQANLSASVRCLFRVADEVVSRLEGVKAYGSESGVDDALAQLALQNGVVMADEGSVGIGPVALQILLQVLLKAIERALDK